MAVRRSKRGSSRSRHGGRSARSQNRNTDHRRSSRKTGRASPSSRANGAERERLESRAKARRNAALSDAETGVVPMDESEIRQGLDEDNEGFDDDGALN
jgi:hypothetical protein